MMRKGLGLLKRSRGRVDADDKTLGMARSATAMVALRQEVRIWMVVVAKGNEGARVMATAAVWSAV